MKAKVRSLNLILWVKGQEGWYIEERWSFREINLAVLEGKLQVRRLVRRQVYNVTVFVFCF